MGKEKYFLKNALSALHQKESILHLYPIDILYYFSVLPIKGTVYQYLHQWFLFDKLIKLTLYQFIAQPYASSKFLEILPPYLMSNLTPHCHL